MSEAAATKFSCPSCGRQFSWKPELAGRSAKCKCGATVKIPAKPAAPAPSPAAAAAAAATASDEGNPLDAYDFSATEAAAPPAKRAGVAAAATAPAADAAARCPSCGANMLPGAVICVSCGFNLKTGKRISTVTGGPDADAPAAPAGRAGVGGIPGYAGPPGMRPPRAQEGTDPATIVKMILIPVLLIGVVGGAVFGYKKLAGEKDTGPSLGDDKQVRAMIRDDGATELKKWLEQKQERLVTGMTRQQADGMADRLYGLGATQVLAFGGVMTASLAVELPDDKEKRKAIFEWYKNKYESSLSAAERTRDEGQRYILVRPGL